MRYWFCLKIKIEWINFSQKNLIKFRSKQRLRIKKIKIDLKYKS